MLDETRKRNINHYCETRPATDIRRALIVIRNKINDPTDRADKFTLEEVYVQYAEGLEAKKAERKAS